MDCETSYQISKYELLFLIRMIETVTIRGGYRANELKDIGLVYENLKSYLSNNNIDEPEPPSPDIDKHEENAL